MLKNKLCVLKFLQVLLSLTLIFFATACEHPAGAGDDDSDKSAIEQRILGTWAYDYGYNQDEFSNEELTFNADKTFIVKYGEGEFESGTYKIENDKVHGLSIEWHFTEYGDKNGKIPSDVTSLYKCTFDDDDTVHLDRFSRDRTKMGGMFETFDPPRENTYHRIKDGTKETLTSGKWNVVKNSSFWNNYDCSWEFTTDGNMIDHWTANGIKNEYQGQYEIVQENGKEFLYQKIFMGSETYYEEFWYNFKKLGPNLIHVIAEKHTTCGVEDTNDDNMYFYREVETEKFTYHFANYTLHQTVPKASSYTLTNHPWQLNDYPRFFAGYEIDFLGWYDNPECTGSKLTEAVGNKREYWAKTGVRIKAKEKRDNGAYYYGNNDFTVKAFSDMEEISAKNGDTITVYFEATVSKDYDASMGLDLTDYTGASDFWTNCWHNVKSNNKKIQTTFTFNIDKDIHYENMDDIGFIFAINSSTKDDEILFTDIKFVFLDNTNSYNITYKFGDVSYVARGLKDTDFELPKDSNFFEYINWNIAHSIEILGWYENANFSGNAVTKIPAENTADKTYYAKFNLKGRRSGDWEDNGKMNHDYHVTVPVKALVPGNEFNPKPGDTVTIYFEATLSNNLNQCAGWHLQPDNGWIARDVGSIVTTDKKLSKIFTMKIGDNVTLPSVDELYFDFWYSKEAYDGIITFSDWKFVLLDETNSYNITYHYGNFRETVKAFGVEEYNLPITTNELNSIINWRMAEQEFLGWYDNSSFTGNAFTYIPAGNKTAKEFWMKYNLKTCRRDWDDNGTPNHLWDSEIPLAAVIPDFVASKLKPGTTIKIKVTATPSVSSFTKYFLRLVDLTSTDGINEGWKDIAWTEEGEVLADNKISHIFNLNVHTDASTSELKYILFGIGYNKETYDQSITLSDWKFEVVN